jgi:hypothetical protein
MHATWKGLSGFGAALLCLAGCGTTQPSIKPPKVDPEFILPPADDPRFSEPISYPDKVLNEGLNKRDANRGDLGLPSGPTLPGAGSRFGGPGGMGGMGGMGGPGM